MRGLRRGVHACRGVLQSRRRGHRAEGHDTRAATRQPGPPCLRDADGDAERDRAAEPGRRPGRRPDPADPRFFRDVLLRQCVRLDDRRLRRVTRRFDDSPIDAIEINISCPNIKEGGVQFGNYPEMSARVVEACRKVTTQAAHHEALAEPDRHPRKRTSLHRGRQRRARGDQHRDGHDHRREDATPGDRQRAGRAVRTGDQADRAAEGDAGRRGCASA